MDKGAEHENIEIKHRQIISKLERIIYLLELLTKQQRH